MTLAIDNAHTFRAAVSQGINLFLGAGFATLAKSADGRSLPTGGELAKELQAHFGYNTSPDLTLAQLCTVLSATHQQELNQYFYDRFQVADFDIRYKFITRLSPRLIFTTNVDNLVAKLFEGQSEFWLNDMTVHGSAVYDSQAVDFLPLHGTIHSESRRPMFSATDVAVAPAREAEYWNILRTSMRSRPTVFWGYSLADAGTLQALARSPAIGDPFKDRWALVMPGEANDGLADYYRALGCNIIRGSSSDFLEFAKSLPKKVDASAGSGRTVFAKFSVPRLHATAQRPIREFFLGAPPAWSDIYSGQLHRTQHVASIRDRIYAGRNVLVIGIPACGKTTAMMQAAAGVEGLGRHLLVVDSLTRSQLHFIKKNLGDERATLLVDNCTDSLDAVVESVRDSRIQVIGIDRDYNYELAAHRFSDAFDIYDATEISRNDQQSCLATVPRDLVTQNPRVRPQFVSLFELVESNLRMPRLSERYKRVLEELASKDKNLMQMLVLASYVHKCRVAVSADLLLAYFSDESVSYAQIIDWRRQLGAIVVEGSPDVIDEPQDYFVPRSALLAEAIFEGVKKPVLRSVLWRFLQNVSPLQIPRYDTFSRYGYDNAIVLKAFSDVREGVSFYEKLYERERSPYILQHGALYLSRKARYPEAFSWIDRAVSESGGRIWSIRNSHAIIMFRANIEHHQDNEARKRLHESMEIIGTCYESDKRKPFHVQTYAQQALDMHKLIGDEEARKYLEIARGWLRDELRRSPWHRGLQRLSKKIASEV